MKLAVVRNKLARVERAIERAIERGETPGAVVLARLGQFMNRHLPEALR